MVSASKPTLKGRLSVLEHQSSFGNLKLGILLEQQPSLPYLCPPPEQLTVLLHISILLVPAEPCPHPTFTSQESFTLAKEPAPLICLSIASRWGYTSLMREKNVLSVPSSAEKSSLIA